MVLFKINGERNSGTIYLTRLLEKNGFPVFVQNIKKKTIQYWKHGIPDSKQKCLDERVVDIFIFRELESWLVSMYKNPYELKRTFNNFNEFLTKKQSSNMYWKTPSSEIVNKDDNNKTIFEIRYYKYNKIKQYQEKEKDIVFVNLSFLQQKNQAENFLNMLSKTYLNQVKQEYNVAIPYTKNNKFLNIQNMSYDIEIKKFTSIIESNKNTQIEQFINNLTYSIK